MILSIKIVVVSRCRPEQIKRYQDKLSGPLLDRIDLHITVPALPIADLQNAQAGETSEQVRVRVIAAHKHQMQRQQKVNNELSPSEIDKYIQLGESEQQLLQLAQQRLNLSLVVIIEYCAWRERLLIWPIVPTSIVPMCLRH